MPVRHSGAALLMSVPVFAWLFYWSAFWHHRWGGSGRRGCIPKLQQKTSFSLSRSPSVIWALIYVLLWQRLTSFLTGSAQTGTLGGNNKSPGLPSRWAPWRVACVRRSSPLPSPASPELPIFLPIASSLLLSIFPCPTPPPPSRISSVLGMTSEVVPECWGPEGTPLLSMQVRSCECTCAGSKRGAQCLLWWQNTICRQRSLMHSP